VVLFLISKVKVNNYKSHSETEISLTKVTLLGGRNNVGKTNLLEALFMIHDRLNPEMIIRHFGFRGVNRFHIDSDLWAPIFHNYDMDKECSIYITRNDRIETMILKSNGNYSRKNYFSSIPGSSGFSGGSINTMPQSKMNETDQTAKPIPALDITYKIRSNIYQKSHLVIEPSGFMLEMEENKHTDLPPATFLAARGMWNEDAPRFGQVDIKGESNSILELLQVIEPNLKGLSSVSIADESIMYGDLGIGRKIPIRLMGDGLSRLLSIVLAIATTKNGVVLIDEIENGIHYSVMPNIWSGIEKAAKKFNCQVLATTHSYECLEAAYKGINEHENFSYIRLDRQKNTDTIIPRTYDYDTLSAALTNQWEVR
jgi:predicted ATP-dependent endonuclease of OLD family